MSDPETLTIDINGYPTRVWQKGSGPRLGYLAGFGGLRHSLQPGDPVQAPPSGKASSLP